jgi:hypothetical protein
LVAGIAEFWTSLWGEEGIIATILADAWNWMVGEDGWFTKLITKIAGFATQFLDAGAALITSFWNGLLAKWDEFVAPFKAKLQEFRDALPFSEPKDPTSPLRGLAKAGEAFWGNFMSGMQGVDISGAVRAQLSGMTAQLQTTAPGTNYNFYDGSVRASFPNVRDGRDQVDIERQIEHFLTDADIRRRRGA